MRRAAALLLVLAAVSGCGGDRQEAARSADRFRPVVVGEPAPGRPIPARPRVTRPEQLPGDGRAVVAGVRLPPGRRVRAEGGGVVMWQTVGPPPNPPVLWRRLAARYEATGLWPLLLETSDLELMRDETWRASLRVDPAGVLRSMWRDSLPSEREGGDFFRRLLQPFGRGFPGLAPPGRRRHPGAVREAFEIMDEVVALALVPVGRPADVTAAIGWTGPVNWMDDSARIGAVLRSWEERYGTLVVGAGIDMLYVVPRRLPRDEDLIDFAAEQYALCPDIVQQGTESIRRLAAELRATRTWVCWWD